MMVAEFLGGIKSLQTSDSDDSSTNACGVIRRPEFHWRTRPYFDILVVGMLPATDG
jgi:hypothetical protein